MHKAFYIFLFIFSSLSLLASHNRDRFIRSSVQDPKKNVPVSSFETNRNKAPKEDPTDKYSEFLTRALLGVKPTEGAHAEINSLPTRLEKRKIGNVPPPRPRHVLVTNSSLRLNAQGLREDSSSLLAILPDGDLVMALDNELYVRKKNGEVILIFTLTPSQEVRPYFTSVIYCPQYKAIAAATNDGRIPILSSIGTFRTFRTLNTPGKVEAIAVNAYRKIFAAETSP